MYKVGQDITWDSRLKQTRVRQVRQVSLLLLQNGRIYFEKQNIRWFSWLKPASCRRWPWRRLKASNCAGRACRTIGVFPYICHKKFGMLLLIGRCLKWVGLIAWVRHLVNNLGMRHPTEPSMAVIASLVGQQDNLTIPQLLTLLQTVKSVLKTTVTRAGHSGIPLPAGRYLELLPNQVAEFPSDVAEAMAPGGFAAPPMSVDLNVVWQTARTIPLRNTHREVQLAEAVGESAEHAGPAGLSGSSPGRFANGTDGCNFCRCHGWADGSQAAWCAIAESANFWRRGSESCGRALRARDLLATSLHQRWWEPAAQKAVPPQKAEGKAPGKAAAAADAAGHHKELMVALLKTAMETAGKSFQ